MCECLVETKEYGSNTTQHTALQHNVSPFVHQPPRACAYITLHAHNEVYICPFLSEARPELNSQILELNTGQEASGFVLIALNLIQYLRVVSVQVPLDQDYITSNFGHP